MKIKLPLGFGEKLKMIRKQRGMTTIELAQKAGVTQSYLSKLENGFKKDPSWKVVQALAGALMVDVNVFRDNTQVPLYSIIDHLPPNLQEFVLSEKNVPMLEIAKECAELDLSPEALKMYIRALAQARDLCNNVEK